MDEHDQHQPGEGDSANPNAADDAPARSPESAADATPSDAPPSAEKSASASSPEGRRAKLEDALAATRDDLDVPSREAELEVYKEALRADAREHFLPIPKPAIIEGICELDGLSKAEQKKLCHLAHMLEALYHFEYHKDLEEIKYAYLPLSPETPEEQQYCYPEGHDCDQDEAPPELRAQVDRITGDIRNLLEKANFSPISKVDMDFAMEENHVFDLPVEIDWERFDGEPLIYARGRDRDIVEGKFTMRKLPGYLVRGSLGNVVIGVVLLMLAALVQYMFILDGGARSIIADPSTANANTVAAGDTATFYIDNPVTAKGRELELRVEELAESGQRTPVPVIDLTKPNPPRIGAAGAIVGRVIEDGNLRGLIYRAPPGSALGEDGQQTIVVHWELREKDSGEVLRSGDKPFTVLSNEIPAANLSQFSIASWVLAVLGAFGVLVGLYNYLRKRKLDEEERRLRLMGDTEGLRKMTIERNRALRVDRFKDLFREEAIPGDMYRQVVIVFKLRGEPYVLLKLFKDIPLADLELIFPNTRPRMKIKDRVMLLVSGTAAIGMLLVKVIGILFAAVFTFGIGTIIALATAGGAAGRAWAKFKNTVNRYNQVLTESLYYKNLDNNFGVVHFLLDNVEEQELKEALLGYAFLYQQRRAMTADELDGAIEAWIEQRFEKSVDFEVDDAVEKMQRYGILREAGSNEAGEELYTVPDLDEALHSLDSIWDDLFQFRDDEREESAESVRARTAVIDRNTREIGPNSSDS